MIPGIVWNSAGTTAYVTGMGSNNLVVINTQGARAGQADTIELAQGLMVLALDEERQQLYVWNRFAAFLSAISTESETEISRAIRN